MPQAKLPAACHSNDALCVLAQLLESTAIDVRRSFQAHPQGSTKVAEELVEADLVEPWVVIPLETDTIPVDVEGSRCWNGIELRLRFFHPQVRDGKVTYDAELASNVALSNEVACRDSSWS